MINNTNYGYYVKQLEIEIDPNSSFVYQQIFNSFRVLKAPADVLQYRLGKSSEWTNFEEGTGYETNFNYAKGEFELLPQFEIRNLSNAKQKATVFIGIGRVNDDRTVIGEGTEINVQQTPYQTFSCENQAIPEGGVLTVDNSGYKHVLIQNVSSNNIRILAENGVLILPNGTFEMDLQASINIYGTAGDSVVISQFN